MFTASRKLPSSQARRTSWAARASSSGTDASAIPEYRRTESELRCSTWSSSRRAASIDSTARRAAQSVTFRGLGRRGSSSSSGELSASIATSAP